MELLTVKTIGSKEVKAMPKIKPSKTFKSNLRALLNCEIDVKNISKVSLVIDSAKVSNFAIRCDFKDALKVACKNFIEENFADDSEDLQKIKQTILYNLNKSSDADITRLMMSMLDSMNKCNVEEFNFDGEKIGVTVKDEKALEVLESVAFIKGSLNAKAKHLQKVLLDNAIHSQMVSYNQLYVTLSNTSITMLSENEIQYAPIDDINKMLSSIGLKMVEPDKIYNGRQRLMDKANKLFLLVE